MKVAALGVSRYLSDRFFLSKKAKITPFRWNQLDVAIVFLSIIGIALEEIEGQVFPINPTIIRVMRVLRIARVLKLLKMAKGIRALLDTVMQALPQVCVDFPPTGLLLLFSGWQPWPPLLPPVLHLCCPRC